MDIRVSVIGAGSWGTTVAALAAHNAPTQLWSRRASLAEQIDRDHENGDYLEGYRLPSQLRATADLEKAAEVIARAAETVWELPEAKPDVLERPEVLGIEYLGPDAATIRVQGKTRPGSQWRVSRLLRVKIAESLAEAGIEMPRSTYLRSPGGT